MLSHPSLFFAAEAACLFVVLSTPLAYRASQATVGRFLLPTCSGSGATSRATVFGVIVHALLFAAITFGLMRLGP